MSGPAPAAPALRPASPGRTTDRLLRSWAGAPRLGLLPVAVALLLFVAVGSPPTAQAAAPAAPTNLSVDFRKSGGINDPVDIVEYEQLVLTWTDPTGPLTGYEVSVDDGSSWQYLASWYHSGGSDKFVTEDVSVLGMTPGNTYQMRIRAVNDDGKSPPSNAVGITVPKTDVNLSADMGVNAVTLRWARERSESIEKWQYRKDSGPWIDVAGGASAKSVTDTAIENQTAYQYQVRAVNGDGDLEVESKALSLTAGKIGEGIRGVGGGHEAFGNSIAVCADDQTLYVGAPTAADYSGKVYIFTKSGPVWAHSDTMLHNSHGLSASGSHDFGNAVALSADCNTLAVGAPSNLLNDGNDGSVHIYMRSGSVWAHETTIEDGTHGLDLTFYSGFGYGLTLSPDGNTLYAGSVDGREAVHIFVKSGSTWSLSTTIRSGSHGLTLNESGFFGADIALGPDGDALYVTERRNDTGGTDRGAVHVFTDDGTGWSHSTKIAHDTHGLSLANGDTFGTSVAISTDGKTLYVGAGFDSTGGTNRGAVHIFTWSGSSWSHDSTIEDGVGGLSLSDRGYLGYGVAVTPDGSTLFAGAPGRNIGIKVKGAVYLFNLVEEAPANAPPAGAGPFLYLSNVAQPGTVRFFSKITSYRLAQTFRTGLDPNGYVLTDVVIGGDFEGSSFPDIYVSKVSGGYPSDNIGTLTSVGKAADKRYHYEAASAAGIHLEPETDYAIVLAPATGRVDITSVTTDSMDSIPTKGWELKACHGSGTSGVSWGAYGYGCPNIGLLGHPRSQAVSNIGQSASDEDASSSSSNSQRFTTGAHSAGYLLDTIEVMATPEEGKAPVFTLSKEGETGNILVTFDSTYVGDRWRLTTDEVVWLAQSANYYLKIDGSLDLSLTESGNEDAGGLPGWSIRDSKQIFINNEWTDSDLPLRMSIEARKVKELVSNWSESELSQNFWVNDDRRLFQRFTAGAKADTDGYLVTKVDLEMRGADSDPAPRFAISRVDSDQEPWYWVYNLRGDIDSRGNKDYSFTPSSRERLGPGIDWAVYLLKADDGGDDGDINIQRVDSVAESSRITSGWDIQKERSSEDSGSNWSDASGDVALKMRIWGVPFTRHAPAAIEELAATVSAADPRNVRLSWSAPAQGVDPISSYEVRYRASGGSYGLWTKITGSGADTTAHIVPNLTIGTTHYFQVRAVSPRGEGAFPLITAQAATEGVPAAIDDLKAAVDSGQVTLTWSAPADNGLEIESFELRLRTGNGEWNAWSEISGSDADTTTYTLSNPTYGTKYSFQVRAVNSAGEAGDSNTATATPTNVPARIDDLTARGITEAVELEWSAPDDNGAAITKYQVRQREVAGGSWSGWTDIPDSNSDSEAGTISHTVLNLTNGTEYSFQVRAVNDEGEADASNTATATPAARPAAIDTLSASPGDGRVTLSWGRPANNGSAITEFEYRQQSGGSWGSWTDISGSGANTTSHTVTNLTNGTSYSFQVRAVNAKGDGPDSNTATATPASTAAKPSKITSLSATPGDGRVTLRWNTPSNGGSAITEYEYRQREGNGSWGSWTDISSSGAATRSHTVSSLTNGTSYSFQVRAVNGVGDGPDSNTATTTPSARPVITRPAEITNLSANGGNTRVTLSWRTPANGGSAITGYEYRQREGNGSWGSWTDISGSGANTTSHTVTMLRNGVSYSFQVRAVNTAGEGADSNTATTTPAASATRPARITGLQANPGNGEVGLTWRTPNNGGSAITGYKYRQREGNGSWESWEEISGSGASTTSHTVTMLDNGTSYGFQVRAVNVRGEALASNEATATPTATVRRPAAIGDLSATPSERQVALSWRTPSNGGSAIIRFEARQRNGSNPWLNWSNVPGSGANTTSYTMDNLNNGVTYSFQVRAVNAMGEGPDSNTAIARTPVAKPGASANLWAYPGNDQVTLRWSDPDDGGSAITGFQYQQDGGAWTDIDRSVATTRTYTVTGLRHRQSYAFRVRAVNAVGYGAASHTAWATPDAFAVSRPPDTIRGMTAVAGDGQVTLSWQTPGNGGALITGYQARHREDGGHFEPWSDINGSDQMTIGHTITGLRNGTYYGFQVRAVNVSGQAEGSKETMAFPTDGVMAPEAITDLSAVPGDRQVELSWGTPEDGGAAIMKFQVRWRDAGEDWGEWYDFPGSDANLTNIVMSNANNGVKYGFQVRAVNNRAAAQPSNEVTATPLTPAEWNVSPHFDDGSTTTLRVAENTPPGNNVGRPVRATDDNFDTLTYTLDGPDAAHFSIDRRSGQIRTSGDLNHEAAPTYVVSITASDGRDSDRIDVTITVADQEERPSAPSEPRVIPSAGVSTSLDVSWDEPANTGPAIDGYDVRYRESGTSGWNDWAHTGAGRMTTITGLTADTAYEAQVQAHSAEGSSGWTDPGAGTTHTASLTLTRPTVIDDLSASAGSQDATLTWSVPDDGGSAITGFQVRQRTGSGGWEGWSDIANSGPSSTNYTVANLTNGVDYGFQVQAVNNLGGAGASNEATAKPQWTPPAAPANLTVAVTKTTPGQGGSPHIIELRWDDPQNPDITGYQVRVKLAAAIEWGPWWKALDVDAATPRSRFGFLTEGANYQAQLRAVVGDGVPGAFSRVSFTTPPAD